MSSDVALKELTLETVLQSSERTPAQEPSPAEEQGLSGTLVTLFYGCMFLSGMAGLVYEVLWAEKLSVLFGHSTLAITTVLVAFMAGLGLGSWLFGRLVDRWRRPLWIYGIMELALAGVAVGAYLLIGPLRQLHAALYGAEPGMHLGHYAARFLIAFASLLAPTLLMGGTLPVLSRAVTESNRQIGVRPGRLYGFNTLGAFAGCVLCGFVLLPLWGQWGALLVAVAGNLAVGTMVLTLEKRRLVPRSHIGTGAPETRRARLDRDASPSETSRTVWAAVLLGVSFVTGLCLFSYEVAWARLVGLMVSSSAFSFSTMLATVLVGITLGSLLATALQKRREPTLWWLVAVLTVSAVLVLPLFWAVEFWPLLAVAVQPVIGGSGNGLVAVGLGFCAVLFLPPSLVLGMTFPVATRLYTRSLGSLGRSMGALYAVNTAGAIVGAGVAGLFLLPAEGLHSTLLLTSLFLLGTATLLAICAQPTSRLRRGLVVVGLTLLVLLLAVTPPWDPMLVNSGAVLYANRRTRLLTGGLNAVKAALKEGRVLHAADGISASVAVVEDHTGHRHLRVNGKIDASTRVDMATQLLVGYVPLFAHPDADRVLVVGYGSGVTLGTFTLGSCSSIHCVEMEPAVMHGDRFFRHVNHACLEDRRVKVYINDGRNHLETVRQKYDIIVLEPSNPWIAGIASLFTTEFYQLCHERLQPEGVVAQWVQLYRMDWETYRMAVATFAEQFPYVELFLLNDVDTMLLGSNRPILFDLETVDRLIASSPAIAQDLSRYVGTADALAVLRRTFLLDTEETRSLVRDMGIRNTDEHLRLQYAAASSLFLSSARENNQRLLAAQRSLELPLSSTPGKERERHPDHLSALLFRATWAMEHGRTGRAEAFLRLHLNLDDKVAQAHYLLARILEETGRTKEAEAHLERAEKLDPLIALVRGQELMERRHYARALKQFRKAAENLKSSSSLSREIGRAHEALERPREALESYRRALRMDPADPVARQAVERLERRYPDAAAQPAE